MNHPIYFSGSSAASATDAVGISQPKARLPLISPGTTLAKLRRLVVAMLKLRPMLLIIVLLPTITVGAYEFLFASDQYETDVSFAVRLGNQQQRTSTGLMAVAAQMSGLSGTTQETFMVVDYLQSAAVVNDVKKSIDLEEVYSRKDIDFFSRMAKNLPIEYQLKYWNRRIISEIDTRSGIINLKIFAFNRDESLKLAKLLISLCERLTNDVSVRSRQTTLERIEQDVKRNAEGLADVRKRLQAFRDEDASIDPSSEGEQLVKLEAQLTAKKAAIDVEINSLRSRLETNSPVMANKLQESISLGQEIDSVSRRLTGNRNKDPSVSAKLVEFDTLKTEAAFKEKLYEITLSSYETARDELLKQQVFLIPVSAPALAESATQPKRLSTTASILLACLAIWSVVSLIIAAINDHIY